MPFQMGFEVQRQSIKATQQAFVAHSTDAFLDTHADVEEQMIEDMQQMEDAA